MMVAVSILNEKDNYIDVVDKVNKSNTDFLHLDIMDNTFTKTFSFTYDQAKEICDMSDKKIDIHIMSNNLEEILDYYIKLKPYSISIHFEAVDNIEKYIKRIKKEKIKAFLAINPDTNASDIFPYLELIDGILIMSVFPGKSGQSFIEDTVIKAKELAKLKDEYNYIIEIDGGINNNTIKMVKEYVDIAVSGSYITTSDNYNEKINSLL